MSFGKFDPADDPANVHKNFSEFVAAFAYEYEAITKQPPADEADPVKWHEINKRRQFLGKYVSRNFQRDFEDTVDVQSRTTLTFDSMVQRMLERYKPTKNTTLGNFEFHKLRQHDDERFDDFVNRVKKEAENCNFTCASDTCDVRDTLIRDQVVIGTSNNEIRRHALKDQWKLEELCVRGRQLEAASQGARRLVQEERREVRSEVSRVAGKYSKKNRLQQRQKEESTKKKCNFCNGTSCRGGRECFARSKECFACGKKGHIKGAPACPKLTSDSVKTPSNRRVEEGDSDESESDSDEAAIARVPVKNIRSCRYVAHVRRSEARRSSKRGSTSKFEVEIVVKERKIPAFADTGADVSVMSAKLAADLGLQLEKTKMRLKPFGSKSLKCGGSYMGTVMFGANVANIKFYIVPRDVETLLSGAAAEALGIISVHRGDQSDIRRCEVKTDFEADESVTAILESFPECTEGVGKLKNYQVKFHVDDTVEPVACPLRPVPYHLRHRLEEELRVMEEQDIIEPHEGPAPWVSNIVLSPKDSGIRVTVDMRKANKAIKATNIPIPRVEDIRAEVAGCKVFSKLDLKSAFHQLELAPESRYLTVFHAGDRLMRYKRLTMGTKPASGELNKALRPLFASIPGVHIIHDDLIIASPDGQSHDAALEQVMKVLSTNGLTVNLAKCLVKRKQIPFWGMVLSEEGVLPDQSRIDALEGASCPKSKDEVLSFICMVQSCGEFIPNLSRRTAHLRQLTKKSARFIWTEECHAEYEDLKTALKQEFMLHHYDPLLPTVLFVDAHVTGLSAILAQERGPGEYSPISCASRATTGIERRYPQLDLEALSIDFALRRYRQYLAGGPTCSVYTDHKPLVSIFGSARKGSIRTERIMLRHQDLDYRVVWKSGKENPADFLSRHASPLESVPQEWQEESTELEKTIWLLRFSPYTEALSMDRIARETAKDTVLRKLRDAIHKGFIMPEDKATLAEFSSVFSELSISDLGMILKGDQIVLPASMQKKAVRKAHQGGHPGMDAMKRRIRSHFWFPRMNGLVEAELKACKSCQLFTRKGEKEVMGVMPTPEKVWDTVNVDLFGPMPNHKHVLVVQDQLSRYPAAKIVPSTAAKPVLSALDDVYESYGYPGTHRSDNGPPFNSKAFADFSEERGIKHERVYEYHPQANPSETFMKPVGKAMKAAKINGQDQGEALKDLLMSYRGTPHSATQLAPGDMMFRNGYQTGFPRRTVSQAEFEQARANEIRKKEERAKAINDAGRRKPLDFRNGDRVLIKDHSRTRKFDPLFEPTPYQVVEVTKKGAILERGDGARRRRHVDDIKLLTHVAGEESLPSTMFLDWGDIPQEPGMPVLPANHEREDDVPELVEEEAGMTEQRAADLSQAGSAEGDQGAAADDASGVSQEVERKVRDAISERDRKLKALQTARQ